MVSPEPVTGELANGVKYSSTRLLLVSATYKLLSLSSASAVGLHSPSEVGGTSVAKSPVQWVCVKSRCPNTRLALGPSDPIPAAVNGVVYSRIRLSCESATNRSPDGSTTIPVGLHRLLALGGGLPFCPLPHR